MLRFQRWTAAAGIGFTVLAFVGLITSGNSPDTSGKSGTDAKIATYLAKSSSFHRNAAAVFILLVACLLLACFYAGLRDRLSAPDDVRGRANLMFGAGLASVVLLLVSTCLFCAAPLIAHDARPQPIDPNLYRFSQDVGYLLFVAAGGFGAVAVFAVASLALAGVVFPRWFGWVSIVCGVLALASFFFVPMAGYWLWVLIAGILLLVRRPAADGVG